MSAAEAGPAPNGARAPVSRRSAALLLGALLALFGFSMRLLFPSLSVLLPDIIRDTGISAATAGYLTTLPVLCMGVFAPLAPPSAERFGMERTLFVVLVVLALGTALRGWMGVPGLFIGSLLAGASLAVANVLLPALVKRDFAGRVALMMALYTMALTASGSIGAGLTLPLTHALGGSWSLGVSLWALPPAVMALLWTTQLRRKTVARPKGAQRLRGLARDPLAWQVTAFMGLQSAMGYCVMGWLAPILIARGLPGTTAGLVTSVCLLLNVAGCLLIPPLAVRLRDQRALAASLALLSGAFMLCLLFAPLRTVWLWAVLTGIVQGGLLSLSLTMIVLRSGDARVAARLSGMAQTTGYLVAAVGPLIVGLLLEWTGGFPASGGLFAVLAVGCGIAGWGAGRARLVRVERVQLV